MTTLDELLALLPDNTSGEISAADLRTVTSELWYQPLVHAEAVDTQVHDNLPAAGVFTALPAGSKSSMDLSIEAGAPRSCLFTLSAFVDSGVNANAVELALDLSGATVVAAGAKPAQVLRVGGKQYVEATVSLTYVQDLNPGTTTISLMYTAGLAGASVANTALTGVTLG